MTMNPIQTHAIDTTPAPSRRITVEKVAKVEDLSELKAWVARYALKGFVTVIQEIRPDVFRATATASIPVAMEFANTTAL